MLSMNLYRIMMVTVFGVVTVANVFAYDDIYGTDESRSSRRKNKTDKEEVVASSKSETGRDAIVLKSKNLKKYELTSNNMVFITDTTIKGGDYFSDTIRVLDEDGDLEKTLVLKTKVQQNVSFDNGSIVVEDPLEGEDEVAEAVYYADSNDDYTYTQRLNKYHGTDYNVVSDDNETVSLGEGTTSTTIVLSSPYYYPSYYYDPFYDPYWNDPFYWDRPYWAWSYGYWGYHPYHWGGWGCHSYAYHPVPHHHFEPAPVPHHSTLRPSGRSSFVSGRNSGRASTSSRTLTRTDSNFSGERRSSSVRSSNSTVQRSPSNSGLRSSGSYNSGVRTSGSSSSTRSSYYGGSTRTGSVQSSSVRSGSNNNVRSSAGSSSRGSYYNSGTRSSSPSSGVRSSSGSSSRSSYSGGGSGSRSSFSSGSSRSGGFSGGGVRSSGGGGRR